MRGGGSRIDRIGVLKAGVLKAGVLKASVLKAGVLKASVLKAGVLKKLRLNNLVLFTRYYNVHQMTLSCGKGVQCNLVIKTRDYCGARLPPYCARALLLREGQWLHSSTGLGLGGMG